MDTAEDHGPPPLGSLTLPIEIVRHTMEISAHASTPTALSLLRVSKAVNAWIMPILYRSLLSHDNDRLMQTLRSPTFYPLRPSVWVCSAATHVRNIHFICDKLSTRIAIDVLSYCSRIERVVLDCNWMPTDWTPPFRYPKRADIAIIPAPRPWELSVRTSGVSFDSPGWKKQPILKNITHLFLYYDPRYRVQVTHLALSEALPQLTHLGIWRRSGRANTASFIEKIEECLASRDSLRILLLQAVTNDSAPKVIKGQPWESLAKIKDGRLLVGHKDDFEDPWTLLKSDRTVWGDAREKFGKWRDALTKI